MSVTRRGAGCGGRCGTQDVRPSAAGSSRAPRGRLPCDAMEGCPSGASEQTFKHRARNAGRPAVRGDYARVDTLPIPHEAAGFSEARRSAHPWVSRGWNARWDYGRARAGQRTGAAELCFIVVPAKAGTHSPERWLWAPAFAGATILKPCPARRANAACAPQARYRRHRSAPRT
jgi:hypothetical protein